MVGTIRHRSLLLLSFPEVTSFPGSFRAFSFRSWTGKIAAGGDLFAAFVCGCRRIRRRLIRDFREFIPILGDEPLFDFALLRVSRFLNTCPLFSVLRVLRYALAVRRIQSKSKTHAPLLFRSCVCLCVLLS